MDGAAGTQVVPGDPSGKEPRDERFGVHSEVGKLRKVMVHRPELSLQRLTPTNHDELLFDDVLWVERAQYEHDQFVAKMRERGVEVFLLRDLLAEALAASDEGRRRLIELAASEYTVGVSLVDEVRAVLWAMKPDELARHLIGGLTVAEPASTSASWELVARRGGAGRHQRVRPATAAQHAVHPGLVVLDLRGVSINPMFWPARRLEAYNVAAIYRYHPMFADAEFEYWYPRWATTAGSRRPTSAGPRSRAATCSRSATGRS